MKEDGKTITGRKSLRHQGSHQTTLIDILSLLSNRFIPLIANSTLSKKSEYRKKKGGASPMQHLTVPHVSPHASP